GGSPAKLVIEAEQQERNDRDAGDREVLPAEIGRGSLLHRALDLAHSLVPLRAAEQPRRVRNPSGHGDARADEREQHWMVVEETPDDHASTPHKVSADSARRAGGFYHKLLEPWRLR